MVNTFGPLEFFPIGYTSIRDRVYSTAVLDNPTLRNNMTDIILASVSEDMLDKT